LILIPRGSCDGNWQTFTGVAPNAEPIAGHIEKRTGLIRAYLSRVECGHTIPTLGTLDKWAKALDLEASQLFFSGKGQPEAPKSAKQISLGKDEEKILGFFKKMPLHDKQLLLSLARKMTTAKTERAR